MFCLYLLHLVAMVMVSATMDALFLVIEITVVSGFLLITDANRNLKTANC